MNKAIKIISALIMVVMITTAMSTVFATVNPKDVVEVDGPSVDSLKTAAGKILRTIRNVAATAAVVIIAIFGIKFMIGSTEERAEYKKSFIPLIVGIVVVLGASWIADLIWGMAKIS